MNPLLPPRKIGYRPIEVEDVKYLWAAYKKGSLSTLGLAEGMAPDEFKVAFERLVIENVHAAWTLFGETPKGFIPTGIVLATWAPHAVYLIVSAIIWMPWATKRNMVECMVCFVNSIRKEFSFVGYALPEHKRMYEICAKHGIVSRVGTSHVVIPGKACAVFETRAL